MNNRYHTEYFQGEPIEEEEEEEETPQLAIQDKSKERLYQEGTGK